MLVEAEYRGRILILTMNRPDARNALSAALQDELHGYYDEAERDDAIRVVVLTGAGDRAFSAGGDLKEIGSHVAGDPRPAGRGGINTREFSKPLIAAVNGLAFGGGFELVLSCDLVVAEEHATFCLPEAKRGLVAMGGGLRRLAQRVPLAVALEFVMTGEPVSAARALELGLVNRVVPSGEGVAGAVRLAESVCSCGPLALQISKRLMRASVEQGEPELIALQAELVEFLMQSDDVREGILAFKEKRPPLWSGH